jgi:putative ABC transport system permease protein
MSYSLTTLWYERQRYLPGMLAVAFSTLLIALQCGLLLGLFSITSMPIDHNKADVWMGAPKVLSVDLGRPIREGYLARMAGQPEIERCEVYLQGFAYWSTRDGKTQLCMVIGSRLGKDSLGAVKELGSEERAQLSEPGAIVIDRSDANALGVAKVGDSAEVSGFHVRVVGFTNGLKSLAGPYVFCSVTTARRLLRLQSDQVTFVLGKCAPGANARAVADRLSEPEKERRGEATVKAYEAADFSRQSKWYWLTKTKAGIALGYAAALGLLVGAVVTSQTLYAATAASLREYAVLRALGIPRWRMAVMVMSQAFWVGIIGICLALPVTFLLARLADWLNVQVLLYWWLLCGAAAITLIMALASGLLALRSLRQAEPATLLR